MLEAITLGSELALARIATNVTYTVCTVLNSLKSVKKAEAVSLYSNCYSYSHFLGRSRRKKEKKSCKLSFPRESKRISFRTDNRVASLCFLIDPS